MMLYGTILAILAVCFAFICYKDIKMSAGLVLMLLPVYLLRFSIAGLPFTFLEVMILILFCFWALKHKGMRSFPKYSKQFLIPSAVLLASAIAGVAVSDNLLSALGIFKAYFIEPMLFFAVAISVFRTYDDILFALWRLCVGVILISVFGIFQYFSGTAIPVPWDIERRVTSFYTFPNAVGLFVAPVVALILPIVARAFVSMKPKYFFLAISASALGALVIIFAKSEAALGALAIVFLLMLVTSRMGRFAALLIVLATTITLASAPALRATIIQKAALQDYSGQVRLSQWSETADMLRDRPIFGAGLAGYPTALAPYHKAEQYEIFQYPHNIFLNIWTELGLLGLAAFVLFAILSLRLFARAWKDRQMRPLALGAFGALLVMFIHGLVDVPYFKNDLAVMTWMIFAVLAMSSVPESEVDGNKIL
ncbi:MAG: O-antigen polymerase [uncultured bacterium]|nr:MAG: O-antigen polymerase [uncultured bacterium]HBD05105.1 hypothetical protein [Candidatus Uhrbacteria bacterium]